MHASKPDAAPANAQFNPLIRSYLVVTVGLSMALSIIGLPLASAARVTYAEVERSRWILSLVVVGSVFGFVLAILPRSLRRTLSEPEPMDAAGSPELARSYAAQRQYSTSVSKRLRSILKWSAAASPSSSLIDVM